MAILYEAKYYEYRKAMAKNLLRLVKHHKKTCDGEDCNISLLLIADIYKEIIGRELTKKEFGMFM
jgi:hypothetical protein